MFPLVHLCKQAMSHGRTLASLFWFQLLRSSLRTTAQEGIIRDQLSVQTIQSSSTNGTATSSVDIPDPRLSISVVQIGARQMPIIATAMPLRLILEHHRLGRHYDCSHCNTGLSMQSFRSIHIFVLSRVVFPDPYGEILLEALISTALLHLTPISLCKNQQRFKKKQSFTFLLLQG